MSDAAVKANGSDASVIEMRAITKIYDTGKVKVEALKGIDLSVGGGEFVAIVGPSGSGKSTLMNLIGCLDTPTGGRYHLKGEAVSGLGKNALADIRNRRIGFVFQNFNLLPQITAFENVEMPLLFGGVAKTRRQHGVVSRSLEAGADPAGDHARRRPGEARRAGGRGPGREYRAGRAVRGLSRTTRFQKKTRSQKTVRLRSLTAR